MSLSRTLMHLKYLKLIVAPSTARFSCSFRSPSTNIINAMFQKENLDTMEVGELVGEIRAHEMGILGMSEEPTSSKSIALKTKVKKHRKLKMIKQESSPSDKEDHH